MLRLGSKAVAWIEKLRGVCTTQSCAPLVKVPLRIHRQLLRRLPAQQLRFGTWIHSSIFVPCHPTTRSGPCRTHISPLLCLVSGPMSGLLGCVQRFVNLLSRGRGRLLRALFGLQHTWRRRSHMGWTHFSDDVEQARNPSKVAANSKKR